MSRRRADPRAMSAHGMQEGCSLAAPERPQRDWHGAGLEVFQRTGPRVRAPLGLMASKGASGCAADGPGRAVVRASTSSTPSRTGRSSCGAARGIDAKRRSRRRPGPKSHATTTSKRAHNVQRIDIAFLVGKRDPCLLCVTVGINMSSSTADYERALNGDSKLDPVRPDHETPMRLHGSSFLVFALAPPKGLTQTFNLLWVLRFICSRHFTKTGGPRFHQPSPKVQVMQSITPSTDQVPFIDRRSFNISGGT